MSLVLLYVTIYVKGFLFYLVNNFTNIYFKEVRKINYLLAEQQIKQFLIEDIGHNDLTSDTIFPIEEHGEAHFLAKEQGVLAGSRLIKIVYKLLDKTINVHVIKHDGERVKIGDVIATISGPIKHLLAGERLILNLMQHMSGIATATNKAVNILQSDHTRICDTRKTTPGLRMFEKYAVTCGGGFNHRMGLYDGVMIKDNHIAFAGSITNAINLVQAKLGHMVKIEVETETEEQVIEAVEAGAHIIMFDNCSPEEVKQFQTLVPSHITTEASGNITLNSLATYRQTGVDYISLGALTHSVKSLDISLTI